MLNSTLLRISHPARQAGKRRQHWLELLQRLMRLQLSMSVSGHRCMETSVGCWRKESCRAVSLGLIIASHLRKMEIRYQEATRLLHALGCVCVWIYQCVQVCRPQVLYLWLRKYKVVQTISADTSLTTRITSGVHMCMYPVVRVFSHTHLWVNVTTWLQANHKCTRFWAKLLVIGAHFLFLIFPEHNNNSNWIDNNKNNKKILLVLSIIIITITGPHSITNSMR